MSLPGLEKAGGCQRKKFLLPQYAGHPDAQLVVQRDEAGQPARLARFPVVEKIFFGMSSQVLGNALHPDSVERIQFFSEYSRALLVEHCPLSPRGKTLASLP